MEDLKIPAKRAKGKMITVRFDDGEYATLTAKARKAGVPLATMVRAAAVYLIENNVKVN